MNVLTFPRYMSMNVGGEGILWIQIRTGFGILKVTVTTLNYLFEGHSITIFFYLKKFCRKKN